MMNDPFPPEDFDGWAEDYDQSVANTENFPFTNYSQVLDKVVELARVQRGMNILDLGIGTGNLALNFQALGCQIWGTDFSAAMLEKARIKLPKANLVQADLRGPWPSDLNQRYDRIVSTYVFHHFELNQKIKIIRELASQHLKTEGCILIGDIAFQNLAALEIVKHAAGDEWEDEFYWLADESLPALKKTGLAVEYIQVSSCAGIFTLQN